MRTLIVLAAAAMLLATAEARAERCIDRESCIDGWADEYDDSQSHPLRLLAYIVHPVGYSLEWLVTRPFHEFVAQPDIEPISGHEPHEYYADSPLGSTGSTAARRYHPEER